MADEYLASDVGYNMDRDRILRYARHRHIGPNAQRPLNQKEHEDALVSFAEAIVRNAAIPCRMAKALLCVTLLIGCVLAYAVLDLQDELRRLAVSNAQLEQANRLLTNMKGTDKMCVTWMYDATFTNAKQRMCGHK